MALIPVFRDAARQRGLLGEQEALSAPVAFRLVRDMPFRAPSTPTTEGVIEEWCGTAAEKHALLGALLEELGYATITILATHEFSAADTPWLPPHLLAQVRETPVPGVHTFLRVQHERVRDEWMTVDATWPASSAGLGLPVNEAFEPGEDQRIACDPIEIFHVPEDEDPQALAERVFAIEAGDRAPLHGPFMAALTDWLASSLPPSEG